MLNSENEKKKGRAVSKLWHEIYDNVRSLKPTEWLEQAKEIIKEVSKFISTEHLLFLNILRTVLILHHINNNAIKCEDNKPYRSEIILETMLILKELNLDVKLKTISEFAAQIMNRLEMASFAQKVPESYHAGIYISGISEPKPPSINYELILANIAEREYEEGIEFSKNQIVRMLFIIALHEFGEAEFNYKHCQDEKCPMHPKSPIFRENPLLWPFQPCIKHLKLNKLLSHPLVENFSEKKIK